MLLQAATYGIMCKTLWHDKMFAKQNVIRRTFCLTGLQEWVTVNITHNVGVGARRVSVRPLHCLPLLIRVAPCKGNQADTWTSIVHAFTASSIHCWTHGPCTSCSGAAPKFSLEGVASKHVGCQTNSLNCVQIFFHVQQSISDIGSTCNCTLH